MLATAARWAAKKGKPKMAPIELTAPPEQTQSITRTIFDVVREHGPLTISDVWDHVKVHASALPPSNSYDRPATRPLPLAHHARNLFDGMFAPDKQWT
jgi:hypothetical protein